MSKAKKGWETHEAFIAKSLGLAQPAGSGNQWHDQGDAVDRGHYSDNEYPIVADGKFTERGSFSVKADFLREWVEKAQLMGKRFILPLRFHQEGRTERGTPYVRDEDYVLLPWEDFIELMEFRLDPGVRKID